MRAVFILWLILLTSFIALAQDSTVVTIKTGSSIRDVLTPADIFQYPEYKSGTVYFRNGTKAVAMMNYNSLFDQMLFIDPKGDTLALRDEKTIKYIALDKDTFFYADGYMRLIASNSVVKLVEKKAWELADIRKIGSHNRPATSVGVTSYKTLTDGFGKTHDLVLDEDLLIRKKPQYYFGDRFYNFFPVNKKNLIAVFAEKENHLAKYLKENKPNYGKKEDVQKLAQYLETH